MTSAGEVEQFVYCPHNWWLARHGHDAQGDAAQQGIAAHDAKGRQERRAEFQKRESRWAWTWFARGVAFACSATVLTLEVVYLDSLPHSFIMVGATGTLVAGSSALLVLGIINQRRYRRNQRKAHLVPGRLVASDLSGPGPLLHDPEWNLQGRPDQILETKSGWVPVEFKTGKTPAHPHRNHAQQVGCYLRLVEVATGKAPDYGLLNYPDGVFRIEWNDTLRADVQETLRRIAKARADGSADRDHHHVGRCMGCSRRGACTQRLG